MIAPVIPGSAWFIPRLSSALPILAAFFFALARTQPAPAQQPPPVAAPPDATALYQAGLASLRASKFAEAEAAFRKVVELEPDAPRGYVGVVQVYAAQAQLENAIRFLQAESAKYPLRADLHLALGDTAVRAGQYDLALSAFRAALPPDGGKVGADLFVPRGPAELIAGTPGYDPLAASLRVLTGRDLTPAGEAGIHVRLAETLQLKHEPDAAVTEWKKVDELVPKNAGVLTNLGMQLDAAGKKEEAVRTYREALVLAPSNPVILNNLAFLIADTGGDLYEALRFARRASTLSPRTPAIMDTEAWVALKQGFVDDALGTLLRVVGQEPANIEYRRHLSAAITQRAVRSTASDELVKALNRPPVPGDEEVIRSLLKDLTVEKEANRK